MRKISYYTEINSLTILLYTWTNEKKLMFNSSSTLPQILNE